MKETCRRLVRPALLRAGTLLSDGPRPAIRALSAPARGSAVRALQVVHVSLHSAGTSCIPRDVAYILFDGTCTPRCCPCTSSELST